MTEETTNFPPVNALADQLTTIVSAAQGALNQINTQPQTPNSAIRQLYPSTRGGRSFQNLLNTNRSRTNNSLSTPNNIMNSKRKTSVANEKRNSTTVKKPKMVETLKEVSIL